MNFQEKVDSLCKKMVSDAPVMGMAVEMGMDGKALAKGQCGYADFEKKQPFTAETIVRVFSMSKVLTAVATMILVERGIISLRDQVQKYLPGFRDQKVYEDGNLVPVKRPMELFDLITMQSGIGYDSSSDWNREALSVWQELNKTANEGHSMTTVEFANRIGRCPLKFQPGEHYMYGASADILGAVIEVASGMRYSDFLKKEILLPLGMKDTDFTVPEEKKDRLAKTYDYNKETGELYEDSRPVLGIPYTFNKRPQVEMGGAGICTTLNDYVKFAKMLANYGVSEDGVRILSKTSMDYLPSPALTEAGQVDFDVERIGWTYGHLVQSPLKKGALAYFAFDDEFGWGGATGGRIHVSIKNNAYFVLTTQIFGLGSSNPYSARLRSAHVMEVERLKQEQ